MRRWERIAALVRSRTGSGGSSLRLKKPGGYVPSDAGPRPLVEALEKPGGEQACGGLRQEHNWPEVIPLRLSSLAGLLGLRFSRRWPASRWGYQQRRKARDAAYSPPIAGRASSPPTDHGAVKWGDCMLSLIRKRQSARPFDPKTVPCDLA